MAPLKLYTSPLAYNGTRLEIVLLEKALEWEETIIAFNKLEQRTPEFLKKSPFGNVPLLVLEDGSQVYESRAIGRVVSSIYKDQGTDLVVEYGKEGYADFEMALQVEAMKFEPYVSNILFHTLIAPLIHKPSDPSVYERSKRMLRVNLDAIEKILEGRKYMAGNSYTLADINYIPEVHFLIYSGEGHFITDRPNLKRWWEDVSGREASKKALAKVNKAYDQATGR